MSTKKPQNAVFLLFPVDNPRFICYTNFNRIPMAMTKKADGMSTHREPGALKTGGGYPSGCGFRAGHLNRGGSPSRMLRERCVSAKGFMGAHKGRDHTAQFEWYRELKVLSARLKETLWGGLFVCPEKGRVES